MTRSMAAEEEEKTLGQRRAGAVSLRVILREMQVQYTTHHKDIHTALTKMEFQT